MARINDILNKIVIEKGGVLFSPKTQEEAKRALLGWVRKTLPKRAGFFWSKAIEEFFAQDPKTRDWGKKTNAMKGVIIKTQNLWGKNSLQFDGYGYYGVAVHQLAEVLKMVLRGQFLSNKALKALVASEMVKTSKEQLIVEATLAGIKKPAKVVQQVAHIKNYNVRKKVLFKAKEAPIGAEIALIRKSGLKRVEKELLFLELALDPKEVPAKIEAIKPLPRAGFKYLKILEKSIGFRGERGRRAHIKIIRKLLRATVRGLAVTPVEKPHYYEALRKLFAEKGVIAPFGVQHNKRLFKGIKEEAEKGISALFGGADKKYPRSLLLEIASDINKWRRWDFFEVLAILPILKKDKLVHLANIMRSSSNILYYIKGLKEEGLLKAGQEIDELIKKASLASFGEEYESLYESSCSFAKIPKIKVISAAYEGILYNKKHPDILLAGEITGCCQTLGDAASSCVIQAWESERATVFAVYKNGKMVAQSFFWVAEDEEAGKIAVFDSIETAAKVSFTEIAAVYTEAAKLLKEEGYSCYVGATTYGITGQVRSRMLLSENRRSIGSLCPSSYTDASSAYEIIVG
jgi:hypothetical protein